MPDCASASIEITGTLPAEKLERFYEIVKSEGLGLDYTREVESVQELTDHIESGGNLVLMCHEAPGGKFPETEAFCRQHDLAYTRGDDGHYTWTPTVVYWEPGMSEPCEWTGSVDDHVPHLSATDIHQHLANGTLEGELAMMARAMTLTGKVTLSASAGSSQPAPAAARAV